MKEIPVIQVSDEEAQEYINLNNSKWWIFKTILIIIIIFTLLFWLISYWLNRPSLEDLRKENIKQSDELIKVYDKVIKVYELKKSNAEKCKKNNSFTWFTYDCTLLLK